MIVQTMPRNLRVLTNRRARPPYASDRAIDFRRSRSRCFVCCLYDDPTGDQECARVYERVPWTLVHFHNYYRSPNLTHSTRRA